MKKIGLFLNDNLLIEYPNDPDCYIEAVNDCLLAVGETGEFHELKFFED